MELDSDLNNGGGTHASTSMNIPRTRSDELSCVNDPLAAQQPHLRADKINACQAWEFSTGLGPVSKIAVIDSGIDASNGGPAPSPTPVPHPDFAGKFWKENWHSFGATYPLWDEDGHGTHVAGLAAAGTNNGIGVAGVAYTAWPMSIKIYSACDGPLLTNLINAVRWAADNGASVINMSGGINVDVTDELADGSLKLLKEAIDYAYTRGLTIVATAGNSGRLQIRVPGAFGEVPGYGGIEGEELVLGVMGTFCTGCPNLDNEARHPDSNYGDWFDFGAPFAEDAPTTPGTDILSTIPNEGSCRFGGPRTGYGRDRGTSMAAPQVAGLALLLTTMGFSNTEVWDWIKQGAKDLPCDGGVPCPGNDPYTGHGRINAGRSMQWAYDVRQATGPEMVVEPNAGKRGEQWFNFMAGGFYPGSELKVCYTMPGEPEPYCMRPHEPYSANNLGVFGIGLQPSGTNPPGTWRLYMCQEIPSGPCTSEREFQVIE
jgi:hypothetical protein